MQKDNVGIEKEMSLSPSKILQTQENQPKAH